MDDMNRMPLSRKGIRLVLAGVLVMLAGFILMMGATPKDPQVFNYAMFDFRRLVAAPVVILAGVIVIIVAIMRKPADEDTQNGEDK